MTKNEKKVCKLANCNKNACVLGLCSMHYARQYRYGRLERVNSKQGNKCKIQGCDKKPYVRDMCSKHYYYWLKYKNPIYYEKTKKMHNIEEKYQIEIAELLQYLHHEKEFPLCEIAKLFDVCYDTICDWFKFFEIAVKNRGDFKEGQIPWIKGKNGFIPWNKGLTKETDERVRKYCKNREGFKHSKKTRRIMSEKAKEHWRNPEIAKKMIKGLHLFPNKAELHLNKILQEYFPNEWRYVGDGQVIIGGLCPDFINCNGKKKIIELFGERWHTGDNLLFHRTEEGRKKTFSEFGFDMLVIWDYELNKEENILEKLGGFIND